MQSVNNQKPGTAALHNYKATSPLLMCRVWVVYLQHLTILSVTLFSTHLKLLPEVLPGF